MADRYFVNGGVDNNWGTTGNWSTTSGGAGGSSVPSASDAVFFDANSPNCTVNTTSRTALSLNFTGYTNTITMSQQITVSGAVTLVSAMTIAGSGALIFAATATHTSNGKTWPNNATFNNNNLTFTFADDWTFSGTVTMGSGAGNSSTMNGSTVNFSGSVNFVNTTGSWSGTTIFNINGTGTLTANQSVGAINNPLVFNSAGTITFNSGGALNIGTGGFTYTAGTISFAGGHTFAVVNTSTIDASGMAWDKVQLLGGGSGFTTYTITLSSAINCTGLVTLGRNTSSHVTTINTGTVNCPAGLTVAVGAAGNNITGTSLIKITGAGTISSPSATNGRVDNTLEIDAPGAAIVVTALSTFALGKMLITNYGSLTTDAGSWPTLGGGGGGGTVAYGWVG